MGKLCRSAEELTMRGLVADKLRAMFPDARIVHELPLRYSTNRIDVAAIRPDEIVAVEVKSSRDVIDRLEAQLRAFFPVAARLYVALAPKWNEKLGYVEEKNQRGYTIHRQLYTEAQEVIRRVATSNIGVWTCDAAAGSIAETEEVCAPRYPWAWQMLHMLHVAELTAVAQRHRIAPPTRHDNLVMACANMMNGREVIKAVCRVLRERVAFAAESDPPINIVTEAA